MASSVDLGSKLEKFVTGLIKSGRYGSKSEVMREGVRLIQERETRLAALDVMMERSLSDVEHGRVRPAEAVFERLEARFKELAKTKSR